MPQNLSRTRFDDPVEPDATAQIANTLRGWQWLLFTWKGRINRSQFWAGVLLWVVVNNLLGLSISVVLWMFGTSFDSEDNELFYMIPAISALFWIFFCLQSKRWHDLCEPASKSLHAFSWFGIGFIWVLWKLGTRRGDPSENEYGEPPGSLSDLARP